MANALNAFGASAVKDKQVTPIEFDQAAAEASVAAASVPKAAPAAGTPAPAKRSH
jgi:hypothetical protein